jgi:hypothetical protein
LKNYGAKVIKPCEIRNLPLIFVQAFFFYDTTLFCIQPAVCFDLLIPRGAIVLPVHSLILRVGWNCPCPWNEHWSLVGSDLDTSGSRFFSGTPRAWLANAVFNRSGFNTPTYVIALIYAFLGGVWSLHQCSPSVLIASILVLIGLERQLRIFKQTRVLHLCLKWIRFGLAALFFPPFLTLIVGVG